MLRVFHWGRNDSPADAALPVVIVMADVGVVVAPAAALVDVPDAAAAVVEGDEVELPIHVAAVTSRVIPPA